MNPKGKKETYKILNYFTKHEKLLLSCLMIMSQLHIRINIKQFIEKDAHQT